MISLFNPNPDGEPDPAVEDVEPDPDGQDVDRRAATAPLQAILRDRQPRLIVTPAILAVIVAIFVMMVAASGQVAIPAWTQLRWGAQFGPGIADGQWWRLLSSMWLHAHPLHLGLNAIFLWQFGWYVERLLGSLVFLIVYLLAGVVASAVSVQFHASNGLSVGASGALFGLFGVLLTVAMTSRGKGGLGEMVAGLRPNLLFVLVVNLILGFLVRGIDNAAHMGGLAGGLVLGWLVGRHSLEARPSPRLTLIPILMTVGLVCATVISIGARQDIRAEVARVRTQIDRAEAAFQVARREIEARRRTPADVADEAERTVLPVIHDAQGRADELLRVATAWAAATAASDRNGRIPHATIPADAGARRWQVHRLEVCLARYDDAWRRRMRGLRSGDAAGVADGDARAAVAIRDCSRVLAGS